MSVARPTTAHCRLPDTNSLAGASPSRVAGGGAGRSRLRPVDLRPRIRRAQKTPSRKPSRRRGCPGSRRASRAWATFSAAADGRFSSIHCPAAASRPGFLGGGAGRSGCARWPATLTWRAQGTPCSAASGLGPALVRPVHRPVEDPRSGFAASGSPCTRDCPGPGAWMVCPPARRDDRTAAPRLLHRGAALQGNRRLVSGVGAS